MRIDLFDVKDFIEINKLQEVTSPVLFQRGDIPHPDGLVSNRIFGTTVQSRKNTFAYINLSIKANLLSSFKNILLEIWKK